MTRLLGRGGMGEVWAAVSDHGRSPDGTPARLEVAIKVLLARAAMKPDLVRRFQREATIASAIKSPYVCQLIEVAEADDGAHLLVFEHLNGESLADRLKREQYLPFSEVGPIIEDVLQGLVAAHEAGVVHRDLKPGNIFLEQPREDEGAYAPPSGGFGFEAPEGSPRRERAKILDFGISKISRREKEEPTLTAFDATLGSFAYMAPEQVRGAARADERADIYAVGSVAFRSLSGRLPFEGATAAVLVAMKLDRQAPSLAEATGEQWPAGVERFLERALERRREQRFASAAEALAAWRQVQPGRVKVPAIPTEPPEPLAPVAIPAPPPPPARVPVPPVSRVMQISASPLPAQLAPARAATPMPMPTKPFVAMKPPAEPVYEAPRPMARHGTLTMDDVPEGYAAYEAPSPRPGSSPSLPAPVFAPGPPLATASPASSAPALPRAPLPSYQIIEDNPTEVDGPPEMTFDGSYHPQPAPPDPRDGKRGKTGRH
ncbi:Serine/threonine protein kinase [Minicystis rosea]|nr:Serine/threonine protein kinase [Minicystis rosea]